MGCENAELLFRGPLVALQQLPEIRVIVQGVEGRVQSQVKHRMEVRFGQQAFQLLDSLVVLPYHGEGRGKVRDLPPAEHAVPGRAAQSDGASCLTHRVLRVSQTCQCDAESGVQAGTVGPRRQLIREPRPGRAGGGGLVEEADAEL